MSPSSLPPSSDSAGAPIATMRTLQIGDEWIDERPGGLERYYAELLAHLPGTGTEYRGMVVGSPAVAEATGGKVVAFASSAAPLPRRLAACRRTARSLGRFDLIAAHFALYGLPLLDRFRSTPFVAHFHGPWASESSVDGASGLNTRVKRWVEAQVYLRARRCIVLSRAFGSELVSRYGVEESLVRVVPGGIDVERFDMRLSRLEARSQMQWPSDRFIVLAVRRQVRRMGLENLIDAAEVLAKRSPDLLVLIGGSGPLTPELQQRIREKRLEDHVRLLGRISDADLPVAYRAADMTVVPSQALEGFGLITLESLACGTPVLVSPVGGLPETIEPFAPQCVFANTSTDEITHGIGEALTGSLQLPTDEACRAYAVRGFSWPTIAARVRAVYDEACQ